MNSFKNLLLLLIGAVFISACATGTPQSSKASLSYSEDLSAYRPEVEFNDSLVEEKASNGFRRTQENYQAKSDVTRDLDAKLDTLAENNKEVRRLSAITIQIYSGSSSELAYQARDTAITVLPGVRTVVQYDQPIYKVRVGKFTEKLEAQRNLMKLKPKFPSAITVPAVIYIN